MFNQRQLGIMAACILAVAPIAKAGPQEDALVDKVKQIATQGQDAQTAALVNQYVDQHHDLITAILKMYINYLSQLQATMAASGTTAPDSSQTAPAGTQPITGDAAKPDTVLQTTNAQPAAASQPATGLQAADGLKTGHLAGYPSLPDMAPASSIKQPTAEQLEYAAKVQKEDQARKEYLMTHPWGYTY